MIIDKQGTRIPPFLIEYTQLKKDSKLGFTQGLGNGKVISQSYDNFVQKRETMDSHSYKFFIQDLPLTPYKKWNMKPKFKSLLHNLYRQENILFTQWSDFNRKALKTDKEQYVCLANGNEQFKLVSPIYR